MQRWTFRLASSHCHVTFPVYDSILLRLLIVFFFLSLAINPPVKECGQIEEVTSAEAVGGYLLDPSGEYKMEQARPMYCSPGGWTEILARHSDADEPTVSTIKGPLSIIT